MRRLRSMAITLSWDRERSGFRSILESTEENYEVLIWHYYQPRSIFLQTIYKRLNDAGFTKNVQTWFNNDNDNKLKLGPGKDQNYVDARTRASWSAPKACARVTFECTATATAQMT